LSRKVRAEIYLADYELGRFIRYQQAEARRLGYPIMSTFARDIARGTIGCAPPTEADPVMDAVAEFYHGLKEIERRILAEKYLGFGTKYERARRASMSRGKLESVINSLLYRCLGFLQGKGFFIQKALA
jgi:hypothetical protein